MKLNLQASDVESLKNTLTLIRPLRKFAVFKFTGEYLLVILVNSRSVHLEPQVWCKLKMTSIFTEIEVKSQRDNVITFEINLDLLLTTLKNFEKSNSDGLKIRLQRNINDQAIQSLKNSRLASLAIIYSHINLNSNGVTNQFRIPVRILKGENNLQILKEPELTDVNLIVKLPQDFLAIYRRLEKFKRVGDDMITITANTKTGLHFTLEEDGRFKVTILWNDKLEIQKPVNNLDTESLREAVLRPEESALDENIELQIMIKLSDWQLTAKLLQECKTVILIMSSRECALHCLLEDSDDIGIIYYINGYRLVNNN